jgi:3-oxoacyl-[acyl-carrier-protein] synthase III
MARDAGQLRAGDRVLVAAVGAGFTSGAAVMDWGIE